MRSTWLKAAILINAWVLSGPATAMARSLDCLPVEALNAGQWARAEAVLRANLNRADCTMLATDMRFSLAHVIEKQSVDDPQRACEARDIYRQAVDELKQDTIREVAVQGARRTGAVCECRPPTALREAGRWAEAEAVARERLANPVCESGGEALRFELALLIEQDAGTIPKRACDALPIYEAIAADEGSERSHVARVNASRMRIICDSARAREIADKAAAEAAEAASRREVCTQSGDEDANGLADCADPACNNEARCSAGRDTHRRQWVGLAVGTGVVAAVGASLVLVGAGFDADRERAEADYLAANTAGDAAAVDSAAGRWSHAKDRAVAYGVSGWATLAVAAALGTAATWVWYEGPDLSINVTASGAEARWSF